MSNYKRATFEEEEVSDAPAEAASSPDRVEVSERNKHTKKVNKEKEKNHEEMNRAVMGKHLLSCVGK